MEPGAIATSPMRRYIHWWPLLRGIGVGGLGGVYISLSGECAAPGQKLRAQSKVVSVEIKRA